MDTIRPLFYNWLMKLRILWFVATLVSYVITGAAIYGVFCVIERARLGQPMLCVGDFDILAVVAWPLVVITSWRQVPLELVPALLGASAIVWMSWRGSSSAMSASARAHARPSERPAERQL